MQLPFIAFLVVVGLAGLTIGVGVTRRSQIAPPAEPPRIVVLPEALADMALRLAAATTLDTLLNDVVDWLSSHNSLPLAIAYRYDPATNELVDPVYAGTLSSIPEPIQRIRPGVTIVGEVARERLARYVPDISKESRFGPSAEGMRCAYLMPLHHEATLIGVLCLQSSNQGAFDETHQLIYDRIASLIGHLAMPVIRLGYSEQAIQRFDRFQLVAQRLAGRLDRQQLFQEIVEASREMLDTQMSILLDMDLETIFRGIMSTGIGLTRDKGLRLRQEIAPDLPTITIDATRIRQVLLNLMSNAAKFTVQGEIVLHAERLGNQIIISVSDTGIGIAPEDMPKVFQEFRQIDGSLQRAETGTGLGMPISKRFIQLHGGDIWLESKLGVGTAVSFSLPITEAIVEP